MLRNTLAILFVLVPAFCSGSDTASEQATLDAACEAARQIALAPLKEQLYQECIDVFKKSAEVCEAEVADYNGNRVNASPRFYDLPACKVAFEYRNQHNRSD